MKTLKKLFALVATVATCLSLGATSVLAEGDSTTTTTGSITINNASGDYAAYQVFSGTYNSSTGTLGNITWGSGVTSFNFEIEKTENGTTTKETTNDAAKIAEYLATQSDNSEVVKKFADAAIAAKKNDSSKYYTASTNQNKAEFTSLPFGYYVVENTSVAPSKDSSGTQTDTTGAYTKFILKVVGKATATNKASVPSMTKKVKDTNDSVADSTTEWQDSADYDIGDAVPFQLTGTVASNYADYKTYYFAFHDVEETGLTFKEITSVYVVNGEGDSQTKNVIDSSAYTLVKATDENSPITDGCTFEIKFNNLKDIEAVQGGSKIVVEYTSTLNTSANIGNKGNVNKAKLEFSNNPNEEQSGTDKPGTGETPWDNVIVFTYQTVVNKVDQDNNALKGAKFTLSKVKVGTDGKATEEVVKTFEYSEKDNTDTTVFTFKGLDDGTYVLKETETPAGYNTCDPIEFTVTADHTIEWDGTNRTSVLTSLTVNNTQFSVDDSKNISTSVVNKKGSVLPSTGGIGTTIFYVTGAILMLGAGVLLLSRRNSTSK